MVPRVAQSNEKARQILELEVLRPHKIQDEGHSKDSEYQVQQQDIFKGIA